MPSSFTWLDFSEHERRKMLDVIERFGERTTRDELGLGGVRDAFADSLFPGTSTIQTRARYFLFVPWIYLSLESKETPAATIGQKARKLETSLINALAQSANAFGVIGRRAKENLQRLPSNIYWQGLGTWGIRQYPGSQEEYHRSVDRFYVRQHGHHLSRREFDGEALADAGPENWHYGLPAKPIGFPEAASFTLERSEAEYLRERILASRPRSLLAYLVRNQVDVREASFAWGLTIEPPADLREQIQHGQNFSEAIHGAQLLYNLMLAELRKHAEWVESYRARLAEWWHLIEVRMAELRTWDRKRFWAIVHQGNPRVSRRAVRFLEGWLEQLLRAAALEEIRDNTQLRQLVEDREVQLKGGLSRLRHQRALELWPGAAGDGQLDLRWRAARQIVTDINDGLESTADA